MKLRDLDAWLFGNCEDKKRSFRRQESIVGAQGVMFQCPKCGEGKERGFEDGRGHIKGAHYIQVCFANPQGAPVASVVFDKNARWQMEGTSLDDLTLSPSINCDIAWRDDKGVEHESSCKFHGFVKNGDVA